MGRTAARQPGGLRGRWGAWAGRRAGRSGGQPPDRGGATLGRSGHAAGRSAARGRGGGARGVGARRRGMARRRRTASRHRCGGRDALGLPARRRGDSPTMQRPAAPRRMVPESRRCVRRSRPLHGGSGSHRHGRSPHAHPPTDVRPHRSAAVTRRRRGIRGRSVVRRLRATRRPTARIAALRRATGATMARPRPLRRHEGLRVRP